MVQTHPEVEPFFPEVLQYRTVNYLIIRTCLLQIQPWLVVMLHARFSVVGPIPFLLAAIFSPVHPYIGSTTVLPD